MKSTAPHTLWRYLIRPMLCALTTGILFGFGFNAASNGDIMLSFILGGLAGAVVGWMAIQITDLEDKIAISSENLDAANQYIDDYLERNSIL